MVYKNCEEGIYVYHKIWNKNLQYHSLNGLCNTRTAILKLKIEGKKLKDDSISAELKGYLANGNF